MKTYDELKTENSLLKEESLELHRENQKLREANLLLEKEKFEMTASLQKSQDLLQKATESSKENEEAFKKSLVQTVFYTLVRVKNEFLKAPHNGNLYEFTSEQISNICKTILTSGISEQDESGEPTEEPVTTEDSYLS